MSDPTNIPDDEILPEYSLKGGVRGKYAMRYATGDRLRRTCTSRTEFTPDPECAEWPPREDPACRS
jgi:hypothetical protein